MTQMDTSRSDLLNVFEDAFNDSFPWGLFDDSTDYDTTWRFEVSQGVGILRVVVEDVNNLVSEEFEWELNLRG